MSQRELVTLQYKDTDGGDVLNPKRDICVVRYVLQVKKRPVAV
jgi:hypothetical protein